MKLKENAIISSGQTFRTKVGNDANGEVWVIQMKDLNKTYTAIEQVPNLTHQKNISQKQLLDDGDVLFLAKGNYNKAFVFQESRPAVAVSLFFVIKTDKTKLNAGYLAWFLNQKNTQNLLKSSREGITVSSIKKTTLENLVVPIPTMKEQKLIAKVYAQQRKEEELLIEITEKRKKIIDTLLISKVYESKNKF